MPAGVFPAWQLVRTESTNASTVRRSRTGLMRGSVGAGTTSSGQGSRARRQSRGERARLAAHAPAERRWARVVARLHCPAPRTCTACMHSTRPCDVVHKAQADPVCRAREHSSCKRNWRCPGRCAPPLSTPSRSSASSGRRRRLRTCSHARAQRATLQPAFSRPNVWPVGTHSSENPEWLKQVVVWALEELTTSAQVRVVWAVCAYSHVLARR